MAAEKQYPMDYPIPVFKYDVRFHTLTTKGEETIDKTAAFAEISGLSITNETITYKDGVNGGTNMPGMPTPVELTMKRGIIKKKDALYDWISQFGNKGFKKTDIDITLKDRTDESVVTWKVIQAFPTILEVPTFDATSNEVAIECLTLMADDLSITYEN